MGYAACWENLRGVLLAARGPDDPLVWAAAARAALGLARTGEACYLAGAAALAAGAAEGLGRAAGAGGAAGWPPLAREEEFALQVLDGARQRLARLPGRAGAPFPAPAYRMGSALFPVPDGPGPDAPGPAELRAALAEAGRDDPGSRKSLVIRSRLGEAVADAEAWARAGVTSLYPRRPETDGGRRAPGGSPAAGGGPGGGEENPETLLRSASVGLDALLGRTHPDSMDARERLARFLAGGSGPGIPPEHCPVERPPDADVLEAFWMYMETASARAEAAAGDGEARRAAGRSRKSKYDPAGGGVESKLRPELAAALENLRHSGDERALAAAAAAAECSNLAPVTNENRIFLIRAAEIATRVLEPSRPAAARFMAFTSMSHFLSGQMEQAFEILTKASREFRESHGSSSRVPAAAFVKLGMYVNAMGDPKIALGNYAEALEAFEDTGWDCPAPWAPGRGRGLPPGRAGRDCLLVRISMAACVGPDDPALALEFLAPALDALRNPPPSGGPRPLPWPPELEGRALHAAGMAESCRGDTGRAETFLRRALDAMGPDPRRERLKPVLEALREILAGRDDAASRREAESLAERIAGLGGFDLQGNSEKFSDLFLIARMP
jgi:tetratricopeptide (TPR) repeat protein